MDEEIIALRAFEIDRLRIMHKVLDKHLSQVEASRLLGVTDRQIRNIIQKVREKGARGVIHGNRGRASVRKMGEEVERKIGEIVRERYRDFKPTFASEKLWECEKIRVSREKLRQIMIREGLWRVRRRRGEDHTWRERKQFYGEMVQVDGSHHEWLEGRGPKLVFMGYIDDATNRVFGRFYDYEGVFPAMDSFRRYIVRYGLPRSVYIDKHSTYKTTRQPDTDELLRGEGAQTQFERALWELTVEVIHANSPQAKGRVERIFGTLQDRLIKEMRLASISTREEANRFLERYLPHYNRRFSREAPREGDLHRELPTGIKLEEVFCLKGTRTINNGYIVKWKSRMFVIEQATIAMRIRKVVVMEHFDGNIVLRFNGRDLRYREIIEQKRETRTKAVVVEVRKKKGKYIPPPNHPWRRWEPKLHHNCYLERL